ncbi:fam-a protein [Plasmodium chabaudi chabaudi]|uniref:Fam-a protein n=1 Tax=Plasmodium chabaudi chabaudi TaxID=31271 RepID=A0A4V0K2R1_PLACU|nr:fam-a protein [Plasmodium chabaudi chabaudi]VTZ66751.1 fam-a protein [Plasmodium chabaudi chabaudi]|eukprot:XP_016655686.1 fam-a protein [Plasmodium chabaudi chabaudi]
MNKGYIKIVFVFLSFLVYVSNRTLASESVSDVNDSNSVSTKNIASSNENHENEDLVAPPDPEETKNEKLLEYSEADETEKATEIMDEVIYRLKYNANFNNAYSRYYLNRISHIAFTKYEDQDAARFHIILPNPDKYADIINMLCESKDLYSFGSSDSKGKVIREYYPNLKMIQRSYQNDNTPFNTYSFSLSATVEASEDITMIAKTTIDIYDDISGDKKKGKKKDKKGKSLSKNSIYWDNIARKIVLNKKFINEFGFIVKRRSDHVGVTYVEYDYRYRPCPKNPYERRCEKCITNRMIVPINKIIKFFNE